MSPEGGQAGFGQVDVAVGEGSSILAKARRWEIVDRVYRIACPEKSGFLPWEGSSTDAFSKN